MPGLDAFSFAPDPEQAYALDRRMRLALADSLEHIAEQAKDALPFDFSSLNHIVAGTRAGERYPPVAFSLYADIVLAICDGQHDEATSLLGELALQVPRSHAWRVLPLDAPEHAPHTARYLRAMNNDPNVAFAMRPPLADLARRFEQRALSAYGLMRSAAPELAAEFNTLVTDIIAVVGDDKARYQFDGGSSYFLWGALFLNASSHESDIAMVEVMAHESAHILLYACTDEETLVSNADDELFASPLRTDLRPMDGIFHATFVSARMHWAMCRLLGSGLLDEAAVALAEKARDDDARNFWAGYDVVARHGKLTRTGSTVMKAALDYMAPTR